MYICNWKRCYRFYSSSQILISNWIKRSFGSDIKRALKETKSEDDEVKERVPRWWGDCGWERKELICPRSKTTTPFTLSGCDMVRRTNGHLLEQLGEAGDDEDINQTRCWMFTQRHTFRETQTKWTTLGWVSVRRKPCPGPEVWILWRFVMAAPVPTLCLKGHGVHFTGCHYEWEGLRSDL